MQNVKGFHFAIPNLPKPVYEYLREVSKAQGISPWQGVVLALKALQYVSSVQPEVALRLVEDIKREYPKP